LDLLTMFSLTEEKGVRESMGGKFDQYIIPSQVLNSIPIHVFVYLISSALHIASVFAFKTKPAARVIQKFHFAFTGFMILDVLTYSLIELFEHSIGNGGFISWVLALILFILVGMDLTFMFKYSAHVSNKIKKLKEKFRGTSTVALSMYPQHSHPYEGVARLHMNASKQDINFLTSNFNLLLIIKWAVYCILISILQSSPSLQAWILVILQIVFLSLIAFVGFKYSVLKTRMVLVMRLVVEFLTLGFFVICIFFAGDPDNIEYLSGTTNLLQWLSMLLIFVAVVIELILLVITLVKTKLTEQKNMAKVSTNEPQNSKTNNNRIMANPHSMRVKNGLFKKKSNVEVKMKNP
jgi:hypothetical protein